MPENIAKIHDVFLARVVALQALAKANTSAYRGTSVGGWSAPDSVTGGLTDPKTLTPAFNRDAINENYGQALQGAGAGTIGDIISLQRQIGFVATEERAMRMRYMRPPRATAHAYGRLDGHANANGVFGKIRTAAENAALAGGAETIAAGAAQ
jgi:hypothetical protein